MSVASIVVCAPCCPFFCSRPVGHVCGERGGPAERSPASLLPTQHPSPISPHAHHPLSSAARWWVPPALPARLVRAACMRWVMTRPGIQQLRPNCCQQLLEATWYQDRDSPTGRSRSTLPRRVVNSSPSCKLVLSAYLHVFRGKGLGGGWSEAARRHSRERGRHKLTARGRAWRA